MQNTIKATHHETQSSTGQICPADPAFLLPVQPQNQVLAPQMSACTVVHTLKNVVPSSVSMWLLVANVTMCSCAHLIKRGVQQCQHVAALVCHEETVLQRMQREGIRLHVKERTYTCANSAPRAESLLFSVHQTLPLPRASTDHSPISDH